MNNDSAGISELNFKMERVRKEMESYEEDPSKREEEWKKTLDALIQINNDIKKDGVFADNEEFSEIKPEDIKYLLIPFYQGELIQKFMDNRDSKLDLALRFYDEFYKILNRKESYKLLTQNDDEEKSKKPNMDQMNKERTEKIQMFKYKKALSEKIKVKFIFDNKKYEKENNFDNIKDYWVSYLELCWLKTLESIKMVKLERDSLKYLKENKEKIEEDRKRDIEQSKVKKGMEILKITPDTLKTVDPNHALLKNIEIKTTEHNCLDCMSGNVHSHGTNLNSIVENYTNVKEKVFRPSNMPTMTLDEFAEKEMAFAKEQEEKQKQFQMEKPSSDSEDEAVADRKTYEARSWDDWKDDNPKGSGNRKK